MQLQTVLAALNIWQWRIMLMIWRTMLMAMELEGLLRIGVISKPLKLRYAQRILGIKCDFWAKSFNAAIF